MIRCNENQAIDNGVNTPLDDWCLKSFDAHDLM